MKMEVQDYAQIMVKHLAEGAPFFGGAAVRSFFAAARFPAGMVDYVIDAIQALPTVIRASGVQILIFLGGPAVHPQRSVRGRKRGGGHGLGAFLADYFPHDEPLDLGESNLHRD